MSIATSFIFSVAISLSEAQRETDAGQFYETLKLLILQERREEVVKLIRYPLSNKFKSEDEVLSLFDVIFDDHLKELLRCTNQSHIRKVGWRGYMLLNGSMWIDKVYFGNIEPILGSPSYRADVKAKNNDKQNWFMRLTAVNNGTGQCPDQSQ